MRRHRDLDARLAERLLDGGLRADDAPPEVAGVAVAFEAAGAVDVSPEPPADVLAALVCAIHDGPHPTPTAARRTSVLKQLVTAKTAVAVAVLLGAGGAAAATDTLPDLGGGDGVQQVVDVDPSTTTTTVPTTTTTLDDGTPDPGEAGDGGGGSAGDEHGPPPDTHGAAVSEVARNSELEGREHGKAVCAVASEGKCGPHGDDGSTSTTTTSTTLVEADDAGEGADGPGRRGPSRGRR